MGGCLVVFSLLSQGDGQIAKGLRIVRIEVHGLAIAGDGFVEAALAPERIAEVIERGGI